MKWLPGRLFVRMDVLLASRCFTRKLGSNVAMDPMSSACSHGAIIFALLCWFPIPVSAQTNEMLFKERLISLPVYELLNSRGATTPEQRVQVISEACRDGLLGPEDCVPRRR